MVWTKLVLFFERIFQPSYANYKCDRSNDKENCLQGRDSLEHIKREPYK
jgi:hypothetical protein